MREDLKSKHMFGACVTTTYPVGRPLPQPRRRRGPCQPQATHELAVRKGMKRSVKQTLLSNARAMQAERKK